MPCAVLIALPPRQSVERFLAVGAHPALLLVFRLGGAPAAPNATGTSTSNTAIFSKVCVYDQGPGRRRSVEHVI